MMRAYLLRLHVLDFGHGVGRLEIPQPDTSIRVSRAEHARALAHDGHGIAGRIAEHRTHAVPLPQVPHLVYTTTTIVSVRD